jgi:hypothetical protein
MTDTPPLDLSDPASVARTFARAAAALANHPGRTGSLTHLPGEGELVVTGDLHDHALNFRRIVKAADLQQNAHRHLLLQEVIHGDSRVNGLDLSVRMLARCADLVARFPQRVHVLLSNHELAQLTGEKITKDSINVCDAFDQGLDYLFAEQAESVRAAMEEYLSAMPLAYETEGGVMLAHSVPSPRKIEVFDSQVIHRELTEADRISNGAAYLMVWGRHQNKKITEELAEAWGVSTFVVGHQPPEMGWDTIADNTLVLTSEHDHGQYLKIDLGRAYKRDELIDCVRPLAAIQV